MSIFTNFGLWFSSTDTSKRKENLNKCDLLVKYFTIYTDTTYGVVYDTFTVKTTNLTSIKLKANGATITVNESTAVDFGASPYIYTAVADNADIIAFGNVDMNKCIYFTFIHGNKADINPAAAEILILRIIDPDNSVDSTTIYRSSVAESGQTHTAVNGGYCDKYILTPFVYRGIISDSAFTIEGGKAFVPNLIPFKIGNKNYFSIAKDICISIDNLIGG